MKFRADDFVKSSSNATTEIDGQWVMARPLSLSGFDGFKSRVKHAWGVLIGKYDVLEWHNQ